MDWIHMAMQTTNNNDIHDGDDGDKKNHAKLM